MQITNDTRSTLDRLGLHHLRALDAISSTGNVTLAARKLGLSQPALSHQLTHLREVLGDPLFVRKAGGVAPTPRAAALAEPLRQALARLEAVLESPAVWDPMTARRRFRVAMPDHYAAMVLAGLLPRLEREAPRVDVQLLPLRQGDPGQTSKDDDVELVLGSMRSAPAALKRRKLVEDGLAVAIRRDHPWVGETLDLDSYCAFTHLLISPRGDPAGIVDGRLAALGRDRRIVTTIPSFVAAPLVVASSSLVLTAPRRLLEFMRSRVALRILELPRELELPMFTLGLFWNPRVHADPGHRWFRRLVAESLE